MKYKELFTPDKGLFETIFKPLFPEEYAQIFGATVPQVFDTVAVLKAGNKNLLDSVTTDTYTDIVTAVISVNVADWVKAANAMLAEYDVLNPTKKTTIRTENADEGETFNDVSTDSRKAFNDTEFSPDTQGQTETAKTREYTRSTDEIVSGLSLNADIPDTIKKEFVLRLNKWKQSIIFAIVNEITTAIY